MDTIGKADNYVGVPYRIHGRDPSGWDCWGCVRYLREEIFGKKSPSHAELYTAIDVKSPDAIEALIKQHMAGWVQVELSPGAVLLFKTFGRDAHVGLFLGKGQFIHTLAGCQTTIVPLEQWAHRVVGIYDTE